MMRCLKVQSRPGNLLNIPRNTVVSPVMYRLFNVQAGYLMLMFIYAYNNYGLFLKVVSESAMSALPFNRSDPVRLNCLFYV